MSNNRFRRCQEDHCCYVNNIGNSYIILLLYIDDMLIAGACKQYIDKPKKDLSKELAMKDLDVAKQIHRMRITWDSDIF